MLLLIVKLTAFSALITKLFLSKALLTENMLASIFALAPLTSIADSTPLVLVKTMAKLETEILSALITREISFKIAFSPIKLIFLSIVRVLKLSPLKLPANIKSEKVISLFKTPSFPK